jgi:hypothetical protein
VWFPLLLGNKPSPNSMLKKTQCFLCHNSVGQSLDRAQLGGSAVLGASWACSVASFSQSLPCWECPRWLPLLHVAWISCSMEENIDAQAFESLGSEGPEICVYDILVKGERRGCQASCG